MASKSRKSEKGSGASHHRAANDKENTEPVSYITLQELKEIQGSLLTSDHVDHLVDKFQKFKASDTSEPGPSLKSASFRTTNSHVRDLDRVRDQHRVSSESTSSEEGTKADEAPHTSHVTEPDVKPLTIYDALPAVKSFDFFTVTKPICAEFHKDNNYRSMFQSDEYKKIGIYGCLKPMNQESGVPRVAENIKNVLILKFDSLAKTPRPQKVAGKMRLLALSGSFTITLSQIDDIGKLIRTGPSVVLSERREADGLTYRDGIVIKQNDVYTLSNNLPEVSYIMVFMEDTKSVRQSEIRIIKPEATLTKRTSDDNVDDLPTGQVDEEADDEDDDECSTEFSDLSVSGLVGTPFTESEIINFAKEMVIAIKITCMRLSYKTSKECRHMRVAPALYQKKLGRHFKTIFAQVYTMSGNTTSKTLTSKHNIVMAQIGGSVSVEVTRSHGGKKESLHLGTHDVVCLYAGDTYKIINACGIKPRWYSLTYGN